MAGYAMTLYVPREYHRWLKTEAAMRDLTMTALVQEAVKDWLKQNPREDRPLASKEPEHPKMVARRNVENPSTGNRQVENPLTQNLNNVSSEGDKKDRKQNKITPSMFDQFWQLYPRKADKGKAKTAWEKLSRKPSASCPTWEQIETAIANQKTTPRWQDPQFIPYPATWLNNQRWLDDPTEMNKRNNLSQAEVSTAIAPSESSSRKLLKQHFPNDVLRKAFLQSCYKPAKRLLRLDGQTDSSESSQLMQVLLNFHEEIKDEQKKNLSDELCRLLPGSIDVLTSYIQWLGWMDHPNIKLFSIHNNRAFARFRREYANEDNFERDALTGLSYMRE